MIPPKRLNKSVSGDVNRSSIPRRWVIVGVVVLALAAGATLAFRPLSAFWLLQQGGVVVVELSAVLPAESGGFACLAKPLQDADSQFRLARAIDQLKQSSRLLPGQTYLYYLLGRAYCMAGRYDLAVQTLPKFTGLRQKNPQADLELGFALEKLCPPAGECADVTTAQVWRRAGVLAEHLIANGEAARKQEDFEQALVWYQRAEMLGADLRSTLAFVRYQAALKDGRDSEAYTALEEAVASDAGWVNADLRFLGWYRYGRWQFNVLGNQKEAEETLTRTIEICPDINSYRWEISESYRLIGIIQFRQSRFEESIRNLQYALDVNLSNQWIYFSLGQFYYETTGDSSLAEQQFIKAIELSPNNTQLWRSIVRYWLQKGSSDVARNFCNKAQKNNINLSECHSNP